MACSKSLRAACFSKCWYTAHRQKLSFWAGRSPAKSGFSTCEGFKRGPIRSHDPSPPPSQGFKAQFHAALSIVPLSFLTDISTPNLVESQDGLGLQRLLYQCQQRSEPSHNSRSDCQPSGLNQSPDQSRRHSNR